MIDWQVSDDESGEGAPLPEPEERPWLLARSWRAWLVALLLVAGSVAGGLRWRMAEQQRAMRSDLEQIIQQEERARRAGLSEVAATLLARDVPDRWRDSYLHAIPQGEALRPVELRVSEVRFDGSEGALALLTVDGRPEARYYRLERRGWRRAPLPESAWGATRQLLADGVTVHFRERDRAFAEALAAELPTLRALAAQLGVERRSFPDTIRLEPWEVGPLASNAGHSLALRSPLLVPDEGLSGALSVRLALARTTLWALDDDGQRRAPRNAARLRSALRDVVALRWALPPDEMATVQRRWQAAVQPERWRSAFFSPVATRAVLDPWQPDEAEATALLTADYLYESYGADKVGHLLLRSVGSDSWDALLLPLLGHYAIEVDRAVVAHVRGDAAQVARLQADHAALPVPIGPLTVTLAEAGAGRANALGRVAGLDQPVTLSGFGAALTDPDGAELPSSCLGVYPEIEVEGDWLEPGKQLLVSRAALTEWVPPALPAVAPLPTDSVALATAPDGSLLAVRPDQPPLPLLAAQSGPVNLLTSRPLRLLIHQEIVACNHTWLFLYEEGRGIIGWWLVENNNQGSVTLWHPHEERPYLFRREGQGSIPYRLESGLLRPQPRPGTPSLPGFPIGWDADGRLLVWDWQSATLHAIQMARGEEAAPILSLPIGENHFYRVRAIHPTPEGVG